MSGSYTGIGMKSTWSVYVHMLLYWHFIQLIKNYKIPQYELISKKWLWLTNSANCTLFSNLIFLTRRCKKGKYFFLLKHLAGSLKYLFALKIIDTFFIASFIQKLCCGQAESHALYCWMFEGGTWQQADKKELNVVFFTITRSNGYFDWIFVDSVIFRSKR